MAPDRTLLVLYPGCIVYETALAAELLHPHLPLEVATPDASPRAASCACSIAADRSFADLDPGRYRAVLIPGGEKRAVPQSAGWL